MINDIENKIENIRMLFEKQIVSEIGYLARNIYKMETVTSGLCYIKDLIFLEYDINK